MKISLLLGSLWLAFASIVVSAEKTPLTGTVGNDKNESIAGATVKILQDRKVISTGTSDSAGKYRLEAEPGTYDVECTYAGHTGQRITGVQILAKQDNHLDFRLESGATLDEITVVDRQVAAVDYAAPASVGFAKTEGLKLSTAPSTGELKEVVVREASGKAARSKRKAAPATTAPAPAKPAAAGEPAPPPADEKYRIAFDPETYEEKVEVIRADDVALAETEEVAVVPPPGGPTQPTPRAGLLTAGEWNDLHNWNRHWNDLLADGEIDEYQKMYGFYPKQRYSVLLTNEQDFPVADAAVVLKNGGETVWEARTDNTGKAELWAGLFDRKELSGLRAEATVNGKKQDLGTLKPAKDGFNRFRINAECRAPKNVDIVWAVDATGSMGDEIEYLKTELLDVIGRAKGRNPGLSFRMGTVFYRDNSDAYITKSSGLSYDIAKTVDFIKKQYADGGGDYPEAVHSALEEAIFSQRWSESAVARICFLVLDASPHQSPEVNASLQKSIREAARLGIRIVPVTASGIQKDTEFLMKFFGLATNGTYVFLTDHSGIGGKHLEPTSDEYKVEPLNELLVRLITEYTAIETCEGKSQIVFTGDPQQQGQTWQASYYPNPATSQFTLELPAAVQSVTLYDAEGKAVRKLEKPQAGANVVTISDLSEGFYTIRILKDGQMQSGKLMIVRA